MIYSIATYFIYFIIIAICGWFIEITLQLIEKHKFADRGFLIGPYCPIYGVGGVLITLGLTRNEKSSNRVILCNNCCMCDFRVFY